jgi:phage-related protein
MIVLLHGFMKKSKKTLNADIELARKRKSELENDP